MIITFLTSKKLYPNTVGVLYPLVLWKKILKKNNLNFVLCYSLEKVKKSDFIILDSKYHRDLWDNYKNKIIKDLIILKQKTNKLIYFDTTDSTSSIQIEVFDYINKYWKMQIFKDKNNYKKDFYGGRIFTDYLKYNKTNYEKKISLNNVINNEDIIKKISLAWNASFRKYDFYNSYLNNLFISTSFPNTKYKIYQHKNNRSLNFFNFFETNYSRKTIGYQRKLIKEITNSSNIRLSKYKYYQTLKNTKFCISPFGWGEVAYRDFESIVYGNILVKPDMDHLITWPNFYKKNQTYVSFKWDCSDLKEVLYFCENNYKQLKNLSVNIQEIYKKYISDYNAGTIFTKRLIQLIKEV